MNYKTWIMRIILLVLMPMLFACSFNPFIPPSQTQNPPTGSAAGTAAGAAIGAGGAALLRAKTTFIVAAGLAGAALGYYVTSLRFASSGVMQTGGQVYTLGDYVGINIPTDKLFEENTADFLPEADGILSSVVAVLNRYPNDNILISGNTSGFGRTRYENKLSEERARQIASYLWAHGISDFQSEDIDKLQNIQSFGTHGRKLSYVGYGNYFPISSNLTNDGIRSNSRIQITGYPPNSDFDKNIKCKPFNNIGANDEKQPPEIEPDFSKEFPTEGLPGRPLQENTLESEFAEYTSNNHISSTPQRSYKGETYYNYNSASSAVQTTRGPSVAKHGGPKNFKGE